MKRFFSENIVGNRATLTGSERDHCIKVLRTAPGEQVEVADGKGNTGTGILLNSNGSEAVIELTGPLNSAPRAALPAIAIAIPKNPSRWEYFLEKSTEAGVGEIIPMICRRSEKIHVRMDRSRQVIISAFKQSLRSYLPVLHGPVEFPRIINAGDRAGERYIAFCPPDRQAGKDENPYLGVLHRKNEPALVMVGPEGDFTEEEISLAIGNGFTGVSLGPERLRVETAGVIACNIIRCIDLMS